MKIVIASVLSPLFIVYKKILLVTGSVILTGFFLGAAGNLNHSSTVTELVLEN